MSSKSLTQKSAKISPIYESIVKTAIEMLADKGCFKKDDIIKKLQLQGFEDAIRWDYVREFIKIDSGGTDLIPMAEAYFSYRVTINGTEQRNTIELQQKVPEKFIALGYGKKTAGFALVEPRNGHLVFVVHKFKNAVASGTREASNNFTDNAITRNALSIEERPVLAASLIEEA